MLLLLFLKHVQRSASDSEWPQVDADELQPHEYGDHEGLGFRAR